MKTLLACLILCSASFAATASAVTLADYWPHEDGRQWIYDIHYEEYFGGGSSEDSQGRLYFDGTTTAPTGIAAQWLNSEVASPPALVLERAGVPASIADPLLRRVWLARPDLRAKIAQASVDQPCHAEGTPGWWALLIHGGTAYVQSTTEIGAWRCDLSDTRAWLWLTSDLTPGATSVVQLLPDLASDLFLHVTVGPLETVTVPAGNFANCLRVDYVVDYGVSQCTGPGGEPLGTMHSTTEGYVHYAPGVGPVDSFEEFKTEAVDPGCPDPMGTIASFALELHEPSVPAVPATWGGVKATYR